MINEKIDITYVDPTKSLFITCSHTNQIINYINLTAKWYISRQFQNKQPLLWEGYFKHIKLFLHGEKPTIARKMKELM